MGMPMLVFPLLAMQAWLGPPVTAGQTIGSVTSITAVTIGLWTLKLPLDFSPWSALLTMAAAWAAIVSLLYAAGIPAALMSVTIAVNAAFIFVQHRNFRPTPERNRGKLTEAAIPTIIFLLVFFLTLHIAPEFVRGVLVMLPIGVLATIYYVRRANGTAGFQNFIIYAHGSIIATATFVVAVHLLLERMQIGLVLAISLILSVVASFTVSKIWRVAPAEQ
jgi:uncharacterized membrane protein (GlpM family)